jgi:hypothetical protein
MRLARIGMDIAKQSFELSGVDRRGRLVVRRTLRWPQVIEFFTQLQLCLVKTPTTAKKLEFRGGLSYRHWNVECPSSHSHIGLFSVS